LAVKVVNLEKQFTFSELAKFDGKEGALHMSPTKVKCTMLLRRIFGLKENIWDMKQVRI